MSKGAITAIKFFSILSLSILATLYLKETDFRTSQTYALFILIFSVGLWLTETVPPFSVGLLIIAFLAYSMGYERFTSEAEDIRIYTNTFSSSVIWLLLGGFFLASAMTRTGLDHDLIKTTLRICGSEPSRLLFGIMLITMTASLLISNTATTAMIVAALMPLFKKLGGQSKITKALLMGVPIAATTGGMGTVIGSPPNAIAAAAIAEKGLVMNFTSWLPYGLPLSIVLTFLAWFALKTILLRNAGSLGEFKLEEKKEGEVNPAERRIVVIVIVVTVLLWLTSSIHNLGAAAVSVVPLVVLPLTGILRSQDIRSMGWDTLILVAGGLSLGVSLQHTGLLDLYAGRIAGLDIQPIVFFFIFAYATMLFSNIMSNTATCTVLIPLGISIFPDYAVEIAMIIGLSASSALFLPVSTPPNAIVYSTGFVEQKDFRIGGALIGLLGPAIAVLWVLMLK